MKYATTTELAQLLNVHIATVSQWNKRGDNFPTPAGYIDTGSRIQRAYDVGEVADWLMNREMGVIENQKAIRDKANATIEKHEKKVGEYATLKENAKKKTTRKLIGS